MNSYKQNGFIQIRFDTELNSSLYGYALHIITDVRGLRTP